MIKVLFENHHLYYLPNFIPIMSEMNRRGEYEIHASIPATMPEEEKAIFYKSCNELNIQTISNDDEAKRNQSIKDSAYDVVVVGSGGAGSQAAYAAAEQGAKVLSVSYTHLTLPTSDLV